MSRSDDPMNESNGEIGKSGTHIALAVRLWSSWSTKCQTRAGKFLSHRYKKNGPTKRHLEPSGGHPDAVRNRTTTAVSDGKMPANGCS